VGMWEIMQKGGLVMWPIALCSVVAVVIIVERLIYFRRIRVDEQKLINRLKSTLAKGHHDEALAICESSPSPVSNLMRVGIEHRDDAPSMLRESILDAANMEIPRLERFLSMLGTVANISTLLGLLGTVTGNIRAFGVFGSFGGISDPGQLAKGISEALITTAAGLIVSIPTVIFYNYLVTKVNHIIIRLENRVNDMVHLLQGGGKK
jgi:biopolymer transport protein ExbB